MTLYLIILSFGTSRRRLSLILLLKWKDNFTLIFVPITKLITLLRETDFILKILLLSFQELASRQIQPVKLEILLILINNFLLVLQRPIIRLPLIVFFVIFGWVFFVAADWVLVSCLSLWGAVPWAFGSLVFTRVLLVAALVLLGLFLLACVD